MSGGALRRVALLLLVLVLGFAALTARAVSEGQVELAASDAAWNQGDVRLALEHARRAATHYAPGAPHVGLAYQRMMAVAHGAERRGDVTLAQRAWADVRGAAIETRHVTVAMPGPLREANENLARLARQAAPARGVAERTSGTAEAWAPVDEDRGRPGLANPVWGVGLFLGFCAMASGLFVFVTRGVRPDGKIVAGPLRLGGLLFLVGAASWTVVVLWA